jgi:hypothetical protein
MSAQLDTLDPPTQTRSAEILGFLTPPGDGPIPNVHLDLSPAELEKQLTESIRQKALVHVDVISELLALRAVDPAASVKTLVDTLDANYKLSGLAAKNLAKEVAAAAVSITINMPSKSTPRTITGTTAPEVADAEEVVVEQS